MSAEPIQIDVSDGCATVRMARADKRNALGLEFMDALDRTLRRVGEDPSVRIVVLAADGPAFSAGHDIREMLDRDDAYYAELFARCATLMGTLRRLPQPVIAMVDGIATAAGCQLVAGCDLAVASDRSRFATPGVRIGLFCSTPMVPIARAIGQKRALEMLFTGEPIDAATALSWGLVNRVVPADDLDSTVRALAAQIAQFSATTLAIGKRAFYAQLSLAEPDAYAAMTEVMADNAQRPVAQEGMGAFVEKRPPIWPE